MEKKICAIYCRYSSEQQRDSMSIEAQKSACAEFASKQGWKVYRLYIDEARSGTSDDRQSFQEMLLEAAGKHPPFNFVLVHKLDRFARNRYDSIKYKHLLRKKGIRVVSATQPIIGSGDPTEVILESVLEGMDEFYSLNLARESIKGMAENARRGWFNGGFAPIGYKLVDIQTEKGRKRKLEIVEGEAKIIRKIFSLYLQGLGVTEVRNKMNVAGIKLRGRRFTKNSITNILKNEKYAGDSKFGKKMNRAKRTFDLKFEPVIVKDTHAAIVPRKEWEAAQKMFDRRSKLSPKAIASDYLFSGVIECLLCGRHFVGHGAHGRNEKYRYYVCGKNARIGPKACAQARINADRLEDLIILKLKERLTSQKNLARMIREHNEALGEALKEKAKSLGRLEREIQEFDQKRRRLFEAIENGQAGITQEDIGPRLKELTAMKAEREMDLERLKAQLAAKPIKSQGNIVKEWIEFYKALFQDQDFWKNKALVQQLIVSVKIDERYAYVVYNPALTNDQDRIPLGWDDGAGGPDFTPDPPGSHHAKMAPRAMPYANRIIAVLGFQVFQIKVEDFTKRERRPSRPPLLPVPALL